MARGLQVIEPSDAAQVTTHALRWLDAYDGDVDRVRLPVALAWLAAGRFDRVRTLIGSLDEASILPLLVARYVAWSGDVPTALAVWPRVDAAMSALIDQHALDEALLVLRLASAIELERTATDVGQPQSAARLVASARRDRDIIANRTLDQSTRRFASSIGLGTRPGFADEDDRDYDLIDAARAVIALIHGILGIEPDAARGRIRLRPRMRETWSHLDVREIRFADASLSLTIESHDGHARFRVRQETGAIPLTALLEPIFTGTVLGTEVDGGDARLAPKSVGSGTIVPVQLVLDAERELSVVTGGDGEARV